MTRDTPPGLDAHACEHGHVTYPGHPRCPTCGDPQVATIDLSDQTATVVTWTTSTATPPGVRSPNTIAIVEFDLESPDLGDWRSAESSDLDDWRSAESSDLDDWRSAESPDLDDWRSAESFDLHDTSVRAIGQCTTDDVESGDTVTPVYVEELREKDAGIRVAESQEWDGYRFDPV